MIMSSVVSIAIGILMGFAVGAFVWYVWYANHKLDSRLAEGDITLLASPNYKISEVIRAPMGSRVDKVAPMMMMPQNMGGYVRQMLPDGRVILAPVAMSPQIVTPVQHAMHNTQQPPEQ